jgi:hypothetical protein
MIMNLHYKLASIFNTRPVIVGVVVIQIPLLGMALFNGPMDFDLKTGILLFGGMELAFVVLMVVYGRYGSISFDEEYDGKDFFRKPKDWKEEW